MCESLSLGEKLANLSAEQIREYYISHGLEYNDANGEYARGYS